MAWIFAPESAGSESRSNLGLNHSPIAKSTEPPSDVSSKESTEDFFDALPSGTILELSPEQTFVVEQISSSEDSPARTSARLAVARAWKASAADFSSTSFEWSTKQKSRLSFWKTSQRLGHAEQNEWGKNWPAVGSIVDGILFPLRKSERLTFVNAGSCSLPTPTASDYGTGGNGIKKGKQKPVISLDTMARHNLWPTPCAQETGRSLEQFAEFAKKHRNGRLRPCHLAIAFQMFPTPIANHAKSTRNQTANRSPGAKFRAGTTLTDFVTLFPTPRASDADKGIRTAEGAAKERDRRNNGVDLPTAVRTWPTPMARDFRSGKASEETRSKNSRPLSEEVHSAESPPVTGQLNPTWVEWLMGYPLGWTLLSDTSLIPKATKRLRSILSEKRFEQLRESIGFGISATPSSRSKRVKRSTT